MNDIRILWKFRITGSVKMKRRQFQKNQTYMILIPLLFLATITLIGGCTNSSQDLTKNFENISYSMSKDKVLKELGRPDETHHEKLGDACIWKDKDGAVLIRVKFDRVLNLVIEKELHTSIDDTTIAKPT